MPSDVTGARHYVSCSNEGGVSVLLSAAWNVAVLYRSAECTGSGSVEGRGGVARVATFPPRAASGFFAQCRSPDGSASHSHRGGFDVEVALHTVLSPIPPKARAHPPRHGLITSVNARALTAPRASVT